MPPRKLRDFWDFRGTLTPSGENHTFGTRIGRQLSTDCVEKLSEPLLLVIFELAAHGRRNNDSHGVETANYYYLKVHRKYLSTSFSTQSAESRP